jgi:aromatic ring-opening dioxygenase catalytic subunit (LigB family)
MAFPSPFGPHAFDKLEAYLGGIIPNLPSQPQAIVVISAHWEEKTPTVSICPSPPMLFDYYGFPEKMYHLSYPAPGAPNLGRQIQDLLNKNGIEAKTEGVRGFDHGVFVPFLIIDPSASIPVVMVSLQRDLDPSFHIELGHVLSELRDQNILIIGSGSSYHNLGKFFDGNNEASAYFDTWLNNAITQADATERNSALISWEKAPFARLCHPLAKHLLPLMVASGAGGHDRGITSFRDTIGGKTISCFVFGATPSHP